jgi:outer membrane protein
MNRPILILCLLAGAPAFAAPQLITLADALQQADANVPSLRQARAAIAVSAAQADEARAPLLPQLNGTAAYQRTTSNFIQRPGALPSTVSTMTQTNGATYNFFNFGLTLSQALFDAPSFARWRSMLATLGATKALEQSIRLDAAYNVRLAFFGARASRGLIDVAKETFANQQRHLDQVKGFVEVGSRPEIDLAQARTDVANARVALITAENNYEVGKAQLNQTMGVERDTGYELGGGELAPVDLEDSVIDEQMAVAVKGRPELAAFEEQLRAQSLALQSAKWGYAPTLGASTAVTAGGTQIDSMGWNWNLNVGLSWNLFGGLLTYSQVKEAEAQLQSIQAQRDAQRLQVRLELERARLAVRAAKATLVAANEALENARIREKLAEGRYQAGVGNAIELSDAVLALANAGGQRVSAQLNVETARSQLLRALGRK